MSAPHHRILELTFGAVWKHLFGTIWGPEDSMFAELKQTRIDKELPFITSFIQWWCLYFVLIRAILQTQQHSRLSHSSLYSEFFAESFLRYMTHFHKMSAVWQLGSSYSGWRLYDRLSVSLYARSRHCCSSRWKRNIMCLLAGLQCAVVFHF
jgi:hypothetical protein